VDVGASVKAPRRSVVSVRVVIDIYEHVCIEVYYNTIAQTCS
jgi:hypothetical protein